MTQLTNSVGFLTLPFVQREGVMENKSLLFKFTLTTSGFVVTQAPESSLDIVVGSLVVSSGVKIQRSTCRNPYLG